jgi:hypothetical protein
MTDDGRRKPPPAPRRVSGDDEVVYIPPAPDTERSGARKFPEAFSKLVQTPAEQMRDVRDTQRKMSLQLDGFGQTLNRRLDLFHEELALQRADLAAIRKVVTGEHAKRIDDVEKTLGQKVAKGGGIVGIVLLAAPLLADVLPKYRGLFEAIAGAFQ